jgi:hypothetical protein
MIWLNFVLQFAGLFDLLQLYMQCAAASPTSAAASSKLPFYFWRMLHASYCMKKAACNEQHVNSDDCWGERTASRAVCLISSFKTFPFYFIALNLENFNKASEDGEWSGKTGFSAERYSNIKKAEQKINLYYLSASLMSWLC